MKQSITISIDSAGLQSIYESNMQVAIVMQPDSAVVGGMGESSSCWALAALFAPYESNSISWDADGYSLFATATVLNDGEPIEVLSSTAADENTAYVFKDGIFSAPQKITFVDYAILNEDPRNDLAFGLGVALSVNERTSQTPLTIISALSNETISFQITGDVAIFLSPAGEAGVVFKRIPDDAFALTVSSDTPHANVGFNDALSTFFLVSA